MIRRYYIQLGYSDAQKAPQPIELQADRHEVERDEFGYYDIKLYRKDELVGEFTGVAAWHFKEGFSTIGAMYL